jgi:hypothetical protein
MEFAALCLMEEKQEKCQDGGSLGAVVQLVGI